MVTTKTMELTIGSSASSPSLLNLNPKTHIFLASKSSLPPNPLLQVNHFTTSLKLPHVSRHAATRPLVPQFARKSVSSPPPPTEVEIPSEIEKLPADIAVTETAEPNSRVKLSVEVPPAVCEDCYETVMKGFGKLPKGRGFGKSVPDSLLLRSKARTATIEAILKKTLPHAMSSFTGRGLKDSVRIATDFSELEKTFSTLDTFRYDVIVDVAPDVKWIPENAYKNMKIVVEIDSDIDAQIASEKEFTRRYKSLGAMKIVTDRGLQIGDVAVLDISATKIDEDESKVQSIPAAESKGFHFDTEDGHTVLPGFLDAILGIRLGETKSFPLAFPKTWRQENLRGVNAQFTVECKELFWRDLPELDDSLAGKLISGCSTLQEVKDLLLQKCLEVEQTAKDQATDNAILDQLCKMVEIDVPQTLFEEEGRLLYGAKLLQIQSSMRLSDEQLANLSSPKAVQEYLKGQKENIKAVIKQNLAVGDIFRRENLQFPTEELIKEVENSIEEFKRQGQEYDEDRIKEQVQDVLEGAKVLEWLKEHAEITHTNSSRLLQLPLLKYLS